MPLSGRTILLVDDEPALRRAYERLLITRGATIEVACNGREAVDRALALRPDMVLMDVNMPVMNGLQARERDQRTLPHHVHGSDVLRGHAVGG